MDKLVDLLNNVEFVNVFSFSRGGLTDRLRVNGSVLTPDEGHIFLEDGHLLFELIHGTRQAKNFVELFLEQMVHTYRTNFMRSLFFTLSDDLEELKNRRGKNTYCGATERFYLLDVNNSDLTLTDGKPQVEMEIAEKRIKLITGIWDSIEELARISQPVDFNTPISNIYGIFAPTMIPKTREELAHHVELPLRETCLYLFDLNIRTTYSDLNCTCVGKGYGHLEIDYNTLSDENMQLVQRLIKEKPDTYRLNHDIVIVRIPVKSEQETAGTLSKRAFELIRPFKPQEKKWGLKT